MKECIAEAKLQPPLKITFLKPSGDTLSEVAECLYPSCRSSASVTCEDMNAGVCL